MLQTANLKRENEQLGFEAIVWKKWSYFTCRNPAILTKRRPPGIRTKHLFIHISMDSISGANDTLQITVISWLSGIAVPHKALNPLGFDVGYRNFLHSGHSMCGCASFSMSCLRRSTQTCPGKNRTGTVYKKVNKRNSKLIPCFTCGVRVPLKALPIFYSFFFPLGGGHFTTTSISMELRRGKGLRRVTTLYPSHSLQKWLESA